VDVNSRESSSGAGGFFSVPIRNFSVNVYLIFRPLSEKRLVFAAGRAFLAIKAVLWGVEDRFFEKKLKKA